MPNEQTARNDALGFLRQALGDFTQALPVSARQPLVNEARKHLGVLEALSQPKPAVDTDAPEVQP